jgi:hypothetical protein
MPTCTAPVRGHTRGGGANCPACSSRWGRSYRSFSQPSYSPPTYSSPSYSSSSSSGGGRSSGGGSRTARPKWARAGSNVWYTPAEVQELEPVRANVERQASLDLRDIFLCHAWDDRQGAAKDLYNLLKTRGVNVWFSEEDIRLGVPFLREIDRGLAKSRSGIVLVTPNFLKRIQGESIADKELSVLLQQGQLVPIMHGTTFEALREVSPMLASRNGLSTAEDSMADVATKLADLVAVRV